MKEHFRALTRLKRQLILLISPDSFVETRGSFRFREGQSGILFGGRFRTGVIQQFWARTFTWQERMVAGV